MLAFEVVANFTADTGSFVRGVQAAQASERGFNEEVGESSVRLKGLAVATDDAGDEFLQLAGSAGIARAALANLQRDMLHSDLIRAGGIFGGLGPPGKGVATDVGSFFRQVQTAAAGLLGAMLLISPTVNAIIAGLVSVVALLTSAVVVAAAVAAGFLAIGAAMAFAAFKWRDLLFAAEDGGTGMRRALLAVEAEAYNTAQSLINSLGDGSGSAWARLSRAAVDAFRVVEPYFQRLVDWVANFVAALGGAEGAVSPFLDFIKTWAYEWKKLGEIVNKGLDPNAPGLFERYEAPAKAFAEALATIINSARKLQQMGLGLSMEDLAATFRNLGDFIAKLLPLWSRFSSALTPVALSFSEMLLSLLPLIEGMVDIGEAIMTGVIGPLTQLAMIVTSTILRLPVIGWFVEFAGGIAMAAFAISVLTFKLVPFSKMVELASSALTKFYGLSSMGHLGILAGVLLLVGAFKMLSGASEAAARAQKRFQDAADRESQAIERGASTVNRMTKALVAYRMEVYRTSPLGGRGATAETEARRIEKAYEVAGAAVNKWATETAKAARENVQSTGSITTAQANALVAMKNGEGTRDTYRNFLTQVNLLHKTGAISTAQYAGVMRQLGIGYEDAATGMNLYRLTVQGASQTLAQALVTVQEEADLSNAALERFALNSGQSVTQFSHDAVAALTDVQGGLLGTGVKVTEFFVKQAQAIDQWKEKTAESFNMVSDALSSLAADADLTWAKLEKGLEASVKSLEGLARNMEWLEGKGKASQELLRQMATMPAESAANLAQVLRQQGAGAVNMVDKSLKAGATLAEGIAEQLATALELTLSELTNTMTLIAAEMLDISPEAVRRKVAHLVNTANEEIAKVNPIDVLHGRGAPVFEPPKVDKTVLTEMVSSVTQAGVDAIAGLTASLGSSILATAAVATTAQAVIDTTNEVLGTASPSTVFAAIGSDVITGFVQGLNEGVGAVYAAIATIIASLITATAGASSWLVGAGTSVMEGFFNGMKDYFDSTIDPWLRALAQRIADMKGPPSRDKQQLIPAGRNLMAGLEQGMREGYQNLERNMAFMQSLGVGGVGMGGSSRGSEDDVRINITLDREDVRRDLDWGYVSRGW